MEFYETRVCQSNVFCGSDGSLSQWKIFPNLIQFETILKDRIRISESMSHYFLKVFPVLDWSPVNLRQTLFNFFKRLDRIFARLVKRYKKQEKITPRQKKIISVKTYAEK